MRLFIRKYKPAKGHILMKRIEEDITIEDTPVHYKEHFSQIRINMKFKIKTAFKLYLLVGGIALRNVRPQRRLNCATAS